MKRFLLLSLMTTMLITACFGQRKLVLLKKSNNTTFDYGREAIVTTTDSTLTYLDSIPIASNEAGIIEVQLIGFNDSTKTAVTGTKILRYVKTGGTITLGSATDVLATVTDATLGTATWTVTAVANDIVVRVKGKAGFTIRWQSKTRKIYRAT